MLDVSYRSLFAFVRDCAQIRAYLSIPENALQMEDSAENYIPRKLLEADIMRLLPNGKVVAPSFFF